MKKLFSTPTDTLYTLATIIVIIMIAFPPFHIQHEGYLFSGGYEFIFGSRYHVIDISRLLLQLIALGAVVVTIKRIIDKR